MYYGGAGVNLYVVCYDITSDRNRIKAMKRLKSKGIHSQLSFFEVEADHRNEISRDVEAYVESADRLAIVRVSKRGRIFRIGRMKEGMEWVI